MRHQNRIERDPSAAGPRRLDARPSDSELIGRIRDRDEVALALTMERYSPAVFSAALRVLCRHPDAQEVTQDVFWALWRSPDRFDNGRGPLATWLVILSRSRALDLFRRMQANTARTDEFSIEICSRRPPSITHAADDGILFEELLGRLPEKQSSLVQQVYFEGYALSEVAALERAPIGTIKGRARLALKKLRTELRGPGSNAVAE